ncbi:MAG: DUF2336 domain-containing protein [Rhabdaerophilum sp.]
MLVKSFLSWMDEAPARERAEAATVLAEAWLIGALGEDTPESVEAALTSVLDDPSPMVRRALALAFAESPDAPRPLVLGLAADQPEVSAALVARSPLLTEADLVDLATTGERMALVAIAMRQDVSLAVAQALIRRRDADCAFALVGNAASDIAEEDLLVLIETFGHLPKFRSAVQARPDLPVTARHALMLRTAEGLGHFLTEGGFLPGGRKARLLDDTLQSGTVALARQSAGQISRFVTHLRARAQLTPALLLRSVLGGDLAFITHALADLCALPATRVAALLRGRSDASIIVLLRRAGLPAFAEPVLAAAIIAAARLPAGEGQAEFSLPVLRAAQGACIDVSGEEGVRLMAMLRRFEAQTLREESRARAESLRQDLRQEKAELLTLSLPEDAHDLLRLGGFDAEGERLVEEIVRIQPEAAQPKRRILRERGLILDEPIPDLATVIAEWKAELDARPATVPVFLPAPTQKPGRSRAA